MTRLIPNGGESKFLVYCTTFCIISLHHRKDVYPVSMSYTGPTEMYKNINVAFPPIKDRSAPIALWPFPLGLVHRIWYYFSYILSLHCKRSQLILKLTSNCRRVPSLGRDSRKELNTNNSLTSKSHSSVGCYAQSYGVACWRGANLSFFVGRREDTDRAGRNDMKWEGISDHPVIACSWVSTDFPTM